MAYIPYNVIEGESMTEFELKEEIQLAKERRKDFIERMMKNENI